MNDLKDVILSLGCEHSLEKKQDSILQNLYIDKYLVSNLHKVYLSIQLLCQFQGETYLVKV